jgi:hypothetical protein
VQISLFVKSVGRTLGVGGGEGVLFIRNFCLFFTFASLIFYKSGSLQGICRYEE